MNRWIYVLASAVMLLGALLVLGGRLETQQDPLPRLPQGIGGLEEGQAVFPPTNNWLLDAVDDEERFRRIQIFASGFAPSMWQIGVTGFRYGVYPSPDGSVWSAVPGMPGHIERYDPESGTHEMFRPPYGSGPRGISVDSNAIVWTALAGSGHLARFDRERCGQTWGLGDQCPEGWTLWTTPGPTFQGFEPQTPADNAGADMHYYVWVDRFNGSGLGTNTVFVNGSSSDALLAFHQESETWSILRVPYPLNFYTRLLDARIDDADAGWKGRGIWSNYSSTTNLHTETLRPAVVQIQIRPDPLAY